MTNPLVATARSKVAPDLDLRPESREAYLTTIEPGTDPARRPNVLIVLFDDLGQGDLSSYGSKPIETPRMDALGAEGVVRSKSNVTSNHEADVLVLTESGPTTASFPPSRDAARSDIDLSTPMSA